MIQQSINPADKQLLAEFQTHTPEQVEVLIRNSHEAFKEWSKTPLVQRSAFLKLLAQYFDKNKEQLSRTMTSEMGKTINSSVAEVEKSVWTLNYYAENADNFLLPQQIESDAHRSYVRRDPLGVVLAVMPWNFPLWQVIRFLAPALLAGNTALLKHASNVPQTSLFIEDAISEVGFPDGTLHSLLIPGSQVEQVIRHPFVAAVTLTGSERAGASVASIAGEELKKSVLELGGSDAFIVLPDADIDAAAKAAVDARLINCGQSCIAAKRFIFHEKIYDDMIDKMLSIMKNKVVGNPIHEVTDIGPLATQQILDTAHRQVQKSISAGARAATGSIPLDLGGFFYSPTILVDVDENMPVMQDETFGPIAAIMKVSTDSEALRVANNSRYGLGASIWSGDIDRATVLVEKLEVGNVFVNAMVKSDARLPFGGVKRSGYGRELGGAIGMDEFVNIKTVWIK